MSMISELVEELIDNADLHTKELHDLMYRAANTIVMLSEKARKPKQEWILCSERLPEGDGQVLVNVVAHDRVYDIVLCPADFVEEYYANGKVNAWMPLPLAWEGADDE